MLYRRTDSGERRPDARERPDGHERPDALDEPGGQVAPPGPPAGAAVVVGSFAMGRGQWFARHRHEHHQLAWARRGVLAVRATGTTWVLPPSMALWIPAGTPHATGAAGPALFRSLYFLPDRCPVGWSAPTVVGVSPLLRELISYLSDGALDPAARERAEAVVLDQLRPVSVATVQAPMPHDPRARRVAEALRADPSDGRTLAEWGTRVGASGRTLARAFVTDTGMPYGQWRTRVRLQAAMPLLAGGATVAAVAARVGYASPSAFVAAFRRAVGVPPGAYFAP
ncbi:helix-turn-helix transcriptional regulator [Streptomyces sp. Je 1-4]|uniref:AraC family transcriptional regulator n=1 Tax=Streptomyces TaxID=1883 RepID=UPI0021D86B6A|nr:MULTISPECIES: helix-turn-helix transcriptional regulator [unclassified Streptomyces]UYB40281.1 helix-turn-helix transcriptional regulator [Streptomyces sp. Je 1-4]UZQ36382.1 helix-turn-helix transcriptional regulator [Streptomyces sp. Je 1-4] [Streptomyces sp. Je 1-4 4N24]UZQ43800.1 helix-turn-helix transcriptional regulator [Streptomyces sp. Je 1-4] [Streptomyces sp. Je 1-4 4N24_ara]